MIFLLDTNVISEAQRRRRNPGFDTWWRGVNSMELRISVLSLGEIQRGVENLRGRDDVRAVAVEAWFSEIRLAFADRLLAVDDRVALAWGRMGAGRSRAQIDTLLAATAKVHDAVLVTRNVRDFEGLGVRILNPFS